MRSYFIPVLIFLAACGNKQEENPGKNENTDYLVSLEGIGPIKTSMSQAELEKILQQKIHLGNPTDTVSGSWMDSAKVKFRDAELTFSFTRSYAYADPDSFLMRLDDITTSSPLCRTARGVGTGSTKQEVINAFDDYRIYMGPQFVMINDTTWERSKTLYSISIRKDREGPQIVFYLKDNKVYSVEVGSYYDDQE